MIPDRNGMYVMPGSGRVQGPLINSWTNGRPTVVAIPVPNPTFQGGAPAPLRGRAQRMPQTSPPVNIPVPRRGVGVPLSQQNVTYPLGGRRA